MKKIKRIGKRLTAFMLTVLLASLSLISVVGVSYAQSHPNAVNEGKTNAQIIADDTAAFENSGCFDYHSEHTMEYAEDEIILKLRSAQSTCTSTLNSVEDSFGLTQARLLDEDIFEDEEDKITVSSLGAENCVISTYCLKTDTEDIIALCDRLNELDEVFYAQPNFRYELCDEIPAQVDLSAQSGAGAQAPESTLATANAVADAYTAPPAFGTTEYSGNLKWWFDYCKISSAWSSYADSSTGYGMGKGVTVAVIDTGCNTAHEDIVDNLWDDGKGYCGFYAYGGILHTGTKIAKNDSTNDQSGHGSHCCGTIAMSGKNTVGGIGTAPECKVMVMKADREDNVGSFYDSELISCLKKARDNGADIISMSLGGYGYSYATYLEYQKVSSSCLIFCAAGNDHFDTTEKLHFPSAASCVVGVMALGNSANKTKLADFSNYDTTGNFYKLVAPGTAIYSLDAANSHGYKNLQGTSMATPAAAGMAASYMSYIRGIKGWNWTPAQFQYQIESAVNSSANTLTCSAYSQAQHPVAFAKNASFKVMNLNTLFSSASANPFAGVKAYAFNNSDVESGVKKATDLAVSELDEYVLKRVGVMYWSFDSNRQKISDYSDLKAITGLNYLDLSGSNGVTASNLSTVIGNCGPNLLYLDLTTSSNLTTLSCLQNAKFSNLHYLNIEENAITSLAPLKKFTCLKELHAKKNNISNVTGLSDMKHLEYLDLENNSIVDPTDAIASPFLKTANLSSNKITDSTKLYNFKGAYGNSKFNAADENITFNVSKNCMTNLTVAKANKIKSAIEKNNSINQKAYFKEVVFSYDNQSAASSTTPMTSFELSDMTISREELCNGNLNINSITGFKFYPANANAYTCLNWSCSEEGYFSADGTVLITADKITSCRTLTLTGTAPSGCSATSKVTGTASQTIKLTITAPEVYSAIISDRVIKTGRASRFMVTTNAFTSQVVLRSTTGAGGTDYKYYSLSADTVAAGQSKVAILSIPDEIINTAGNYPLYVFAADSRGNYTPYVTDNDISGTKNYAYKNLGTLYVKDSVETGTTLNLLCDKKVNRYGQGVLFGVNSGTASSSPEKPSGTYSFSVSPSTGKKYVGNGSIYYVYGCGYFGNSYTGYPSAATGDAAITVKVGSVSATAQTVTTVAPEVTSVSVRNAETMKTDGYIEYLVKTNTDATTLKAYALGTTDDISSESNHIFTKLDNTQTYSYGVYSASYSYKLWSIKVPLSTSKTPQAVTLVAADPLGDGSVTKTPAIGFSFTNTKSYYDLYPGETESRSLSTLYKFLPLDENGESLADCCKSVTYSISDSTYYTLSGSKLTCDAKSALNSIEDASKSYLRTAITFTLEKCVTANKNFDINKPKVSSVSYDKETSELVRGGTVYYTAKTYGSDTIYVRDASDKNSAIVLRLNKTDNPEAYTEETDSYGNVYTLWNFERQFPDSDEKTIKSFVRSSFTFDDSFTSNSNSYSSLNVTRNNDPGDYSAWEAQLARADESTLTELQTLYAQDSEIYAARYASFAEAVQEAVLTYDVTQQALIDAQTEAVKPLIDALLGYSDYAESMQAYEAFASGENARYISPALRELAETDANDTNCKRLSCEINNALAQTRALIEAIEEADSYLVELSNEIEQLKSDAVPAEYCIDSYNRVKEIYCALRSGIDTLSYTQASEVNRDYAALSDAVGNLTVHTFQSHISEPSCTQEGYTTYTCSNCGSIYTNDFVPALGHEPAEPVKENLQEADCENDGGYTLVTYCSRCEALLTTEDVITKALGHSWGDWVQTADPDCTNAGEQTRYCQRDASHFETRPVDALGHDFHGVLTPPTCTEQGFTTYTCSRCSYSYQDNFVEKTEHNYAYIEIEPTDKTNGYVAYHCDKCGSYFGATFASGAAQADKEIESVEQAALISPLPAPAFNIFETPTLRYADHKASLKTDESALYEGFETTQGLRFTASVKLPEGVSYQLGSEGNAITDFGLVYSQTERIDNNIENLVQGTKDVFTMRVKEENNTPFDGTNWQGVTYHPEDNTLTFNLVINVKAPNWNKDYCARAFLSYNYNGYSFTVYDEDFASKSVQYVAQQAVESESESQAVKDFCQNKILNNI